MLIVVFAYFHGVHTFIMAYVLHKMLHRDACVWLKEPTLASHCYSPNYWPIIKPNFKTLKAVKEEKVESVYIKNIRLQINYLILFIEFKS